MLEIIIKSFCVVILIYAVITIITKFVCASKKHTKIYFTILRINANTKDVEFALRSIIWKSLSVSCGGIVPEILVVDNGANEETVKIVFNLAKDYQFIHYISEEDFNKLKCKYMI